jgi:hypothetical protein
MWKMAEMARLAKRRLALGVAVLAVLAGGTAVALGATGSSHSQTRHRHAHRHGLVRRQAPGLLAAASSYLGVSGPALRRDLEAGKTLGQIAQASPGKSEAGLVAALLAAARQRLGSASASLPKRIESLVRGRPSPDLAARQGHIQLRQITRSYLGIARKDLVAKLRSGMTLAQIADATPGKSAAGLREAILAAVKQRLDGKVTAHALSQSAAKLRLSNLQSKITALLNRSHPGRMLHARGGSIHSAGHTPRSPRHTLHPHKSSG